MSGNGQVRCVPQDVIGGPVAAELLLYSSPDQAIVVRHIAAYDDGFSFLLVARRREPSKRAFVGAGDFLAGVAGSNGKPDREGPYMAIKLASGQVIDAGVPGMGADGPMLEALGGMAGGDQYIEVEYFCPVLPSRGHVRFYFQWPIAGIEEAEATLEGKQLRAAAKTARPLWSESP